MRKCSFQSSRCSSLSHSNFRCLIALTRLSKNELFFHFIWNTLVSTKLCVGKEIRGAQQRHFHMGLLERKLCFNFAKRELKFSMNQKQRWNLVLFRSFHVQSIHYQESIHVLTILKLSIWILKFTNAFFINHVK